MVSTQHHLVMQRALPPCNKSADSPHTPAASPQGRHRDVAPLHRTRVHQHCHLPIQAISPIAPSAKTLAPTCPNIRFVCSFASPASQSPGTVLHPKGTALLHAISGRSCQSGPCALLRHCTPFRYCIPSAPRSAPHCSPYPRYVSRPAARLLPPHSRAPPYSAAPSPLSPPPLALCSPLGVLVRVRHHHIPLNFQPCPCPPLRTCTSPLPSSSPRVRHIPSSPSSTSADPPRPPPRIPSARPSARPWPPAPGASRSCSCLALRVATVPLLPLQ